MTKKMEHVGPSINLQHSGARNECMAIGPPSKEELRSVTFGMKVNTAIEPDGLMVEVFCTHWNLINVDLLELGWKKILHRASMKYFNLAFLTLVPKNQA